MKKLITERDVLNAWKSGEKQIAVAGGGLVTPAARDAAKVRGIEIVETGPQSAPASPVPVDVKPLARQNIVIGSDHAGFELKETLKAWLAELGYAAEDVGTHSTDSVDYPDVALRVAAAVADNRFRFGIVIDGAGVGSAMAANKVPGIRAAVCHDVFTARNSRQHNDANILTLGSRVVGTGVAQDICRVWLETEFGGGRHKRRVDKITEIEKRFRTS